MNSDSTLSRVSKVDTRSNDSVCEAVQLSRANPHCVACGPENRHGLRLHFRHLATEVATEWSPTEEWVSFQGVIHGGIIATVLDEAMSKAIMGEGWRALTAELRVRFRNVVRPGEIFTACAWVVEKRRCKITAEATLTSRGGLEHAHAYASFLEISE